MKKRHSIQISLSFSLGQMLSETFSWTQRSLESFREERVCPESESVVHRGDGG